MGTKASAPALQRLKEKWRVIGLLIVAFAKLLCRYEDAQAANAYEQVRQLQTIVRAAQIMLVHELAQAAQDFPFQTGDDKRALAFLRMIAVCLLAVHLVLENMIARGLRAAPLRRGMVFAVFARSNSAARAGPVYGVPVLDPG